jgi:hypothetical protein
MTCLLQYRISRLNLTSTQLGSSAIESQRASNGWFALVAVGSLWEGQSKLTPTSMVLMFQTCILVSQDQRAAPSTSEFHSNGKQLCLPKLEMQLLNGKMPLQKKGLSP